MSGFPIRVMIADDEPIARRGIRRLLAAHDDIQIVAEARDGKEVARLLRALSPDLLFLDVQMPEFDGFAALRAAGRTYRPEVIFVTAYDSFAVRAFAADAVDYLVKPVHESRFQESLARAKQRLRARDTRALPTAGRSRAGSSVSGAPRRLMVHTHGGEVLIDVAEIVWIKAYDYYAAVHTNRGRFLIRESLASLEKRLDRALFVRTHRSAIVNLACVQAIRSSHDTEPTLVLHDGTEVLLSRRRRRGVHEMMRRFAG